MLLDWNEHRNELLGVVNEYAKLGNDSNLLIVLYREVVPDDLIMQLHRL